MSGTGPVSFAITAVDQTSAVFESINKRIAKTMEPVDRLTQSFAKLSRVSGMNQAVKGMKDLGEHAVKVGRSMTQVLEPLGVITGAASIAGMVRLTTAWADWGSKLLFTSQNIGISATALQTWQGSAMLAGSSSSALSSGLQTLGQNMWDAIGGRAPQVVAAMQMLHINWRNLNGTAKSTTEVLPQIADRIRALKDPYAQAAVATALLGSAGQDLLPFLRRGSQGIAAYNALALKYGVTSIAGAQAANQLRISQVGLTLAVTGLGNSIAEKLQPVIGPMIDSLANWIANNRGIMATKFTQWIQTFVGWVESAIPKVQAVVGLFGGWQKAARDLAIFMGASWLASMLAPIATVSAALIRMIGLQAGFAASPAGLAILAAAGLLGGTVAAGVAVKNYAMTPTMQGSYEMIGGRPNWRENPNYVPAGPGHYASNHGRQQYYPGTPAYDRPSVPTDVLAYLSKAAQAAGLNPAFMSALARQEGGGYDNVSSAGAIGPMQLMPGTASDMGVKNIGDWRQNVDGGVKYFAQLLKQFNGNYNAAAAAYNAGPNSSAVAQFAQSGNMSLLPGQTQNYVGSIDAMAGPGAASGGIIKIDMHHHNAPAGIQTAVSSSNPAIVPSALQVDTAMGNGW